MDKEELQHLFYEPAISLVTELEMNREDLDIEQLILLEKLKFALRMYELKQAKKEQERNDFEGFFKNF